MNRIVSTITVLGAALTVSGQSWALEGAPTPEEMAAKKKAMMMQMMKGKKKPLSQQYPEMTYKSVNDRLNKNTPRYDLASCSQYFGGPQGSFVPAKGSGPKGSPPGVHGKVGGGITSNCNKREAFGMASISQGGVFVRGLGYFEDVGNYKDGSGNTVTYGFEKKFTTLQVGVNRPGFSASATGGYMLKENILYGGAGVDTKELESRFARVRFAKDLNGLLFNRIVFSGLIRGIDRTNDNFSNRSNAAGIAPPANPPHAEVNVERRDYRARLRGEFNLGRSKNNLGVAFMRDNRDAVRKQGATEATMADQSPNFPDAYVDSYTVFLKSAIPLNPMSRFKTSLKFDHIRANARKANVTLGASPTANAMYASAFGAVGDKTKTENNFGGSLRFERDLMGKTGQIYLEGGRYMRTAGPRERYFASFAGAGSVNNWVGNPDIKPEAHHKIEAGFVFDKGLWNFGGKAYMDFAKNYIIHDRSHGVNAALLGTNYNIYRNVDARIFAAAAKAGFKIRPNLKLGLWGQYTYAKNTDANIPIAQIPPLEGHVTLDFTQKFWSVGAKLRAVARQNRVDDDAATGSGNDDAPTKGFVTVDVYGAVHPVPNASLKFGVENLFDKTYAEHVERVDIGDPNLTKLNAPGRTLWARASLRF